MTMAIHQLTHLPKEAEKLGPIDSFSCFKYENCLKTVKFQCRSFKNPLSNLSKNLKQQSTFVSKATRYSMSSTHPVLKRPLQEPDQDAQLYRSIYFNNISLMTDKDTDCYFMAKDCVMQLEKISESSSRGLQLHARRFEKHSSGFSISLANANGTHTRFKSGLIDVYQVSALNATSELIELNEVQCKCVVNDFHGKQISYPLLNL